MATIARPSFVRQPATAHSLLPIWLSRRLSTDLRNGTFSARERYCCNSLAASGSNAGAMSVLLPAPLAAVELAAAAPLLPPESGTLLASENGCDRYRSSKNSLVAVAVPNTARYVSKAVVAPSSRSNDSWNASALPIAAPSRSVHFSNLVISSAAYCGGNGLRATQALTPSA